MSPELCPICRIGQCETALVYTEPPAGEISFPIADTYYRRYERCNYCGHFKGVCHMDVSALYTHTYVDATYSEGLHASYNRIMSLPPEKSDNHHRVMRISEYALKKAMRCPKLLDIGSGLCVFPACMKKMGWECLALDMDPRQADHARDIAGVEACTGSLESIPAQHQFDVITLNKVLEHITDPIHLLQETQSRLKQNGFVYIEVPDATAALQEGPHREEFFIEHVHVFTDKSLRCMVHQTGYQVDEIQAIHEPSGKYTLTAFLVQ